MEDRYMDRERLDYLASRLRASEKRELLPAWPRTERELPVVELPIDWVRFSTLNHRTRAEQRRATVEANQPDLFSADPLGEHAQTAQHKILTSQPEFDELQEDLRRRGQQEPAVITAEGVLINGNRRAAALRSLLDDYGELDGRYIRCLVLPGDASLEELVLLETELQVAPDFKQQYSWVNECLLIEELYDKLGRSFDRVARQMRKRQAEVRKEYETIQQVHQLVALSKGGLLHVDFEDNQSAFDELAQHIRNKDAEEREGVRAVYFLGTLTDVNYRDLRHLRRADGESLVADELGGDDQLSEVLETARQLVHADELDQVESDPLDDALGQSQSCGAVHQVLRFVARLDRGKPVRLHTGRLVEFADVQTKIGQAVGKAATEAEERRKDRDAVAAPTMRLERARKELQRAKASLPGARAVPGWDEAGFESKLAEVEICIDELKE